MRWPGSTSRRPSISPLRFLAVRPCRDVRGKPETDDGVGRHPAKDLETPGTRRTGCDRARGQGRPMRPRVVSRRAGGLESAERVIAGTRGRDRSGVDRRRRASRRRCRRRGRRQSVRGRSAAIAAAWGLRRARTPPTSTPPTRMSPANRPSTHEDRRSLGLDADDETRAAAGAAPGAVDERSRACRAGEDGLVDLADRERILPRRLRLARSPRRDLDCHPALPPCNSDGRTMRTFTPPSLANRRRGSHRPKVLPLWYVQRRSGIAQSVIDVRFELAERRHSLSGTGSSR